MLHIKCMRNYCALAGIQHSSFVIINFVSRILHRKLTDAKMEDVVGHAMGTAAGRTLNCCPTIQNNVIPILYFVALFIAFILGNACFISSTICVVKDEIGSVVGVLTLFLDITLLLGLSTYLYQKWKYERNSRKEIAKWKRNLERKKRNLENQNKETNIPDHEGVYVELE